MDKTYYLNKYRIGSTRLPHWNYGDPALYFITICTRHRFSYFGEIINETQAGATGQLMQFSEIGKIAEAEWLKTFEMRSDMNLYQGEFVVMPNHFHAIIGIGDNDFNFPQGDLAPHTNSINLPEHRNHFGPQTNNLASIMRGFKSAVTIAARKINPEFQWQARYHDHIIRSEDSFHRISRYIVNNPANWEGDKLRCK